MVLRCQRVDCLQVKHRNGAQFSNEALAIITEMGALLEYCNGWPNRDQFEVYGGKEKLGRINNNIGGLSNVDQEMALLSSGGASQYPNTEESQGPSTPTLAVVIAVPLVAVLIIGIVIGLAVYYVREKKNAVVEQAAFESEDEPSEGDPLQASVVQDPHTQNVPLESDKPAHSGDDSSGEQQ